MTERPRPPGNADVHTGTARRRRAKPRTADREEARGTAWNADLWSARGPRGRNGAPPPGQDDAAGRHAIRMERRYAFARRRRAVPTGGRHSRAGTPSSGPEFGRHPAFSSRNDGLHPAVRLTCQPSAPPRSSASTTRTSSTATTTSPRSSAVTSARPSRRGGRAPPTPTNPGTSPRTSSSGRSPANTGDAAPITSGNAVSSPD